MGLSRVISLPGFISKGQKKEKRGQGEELKGENSQFE